MILLVSMTKPDDDYRANGRNSFANKLKFEDITGHPCIIQHYSQVTAERCRQLGVKAIFISGFSYGWDELPLEQIMGLHGVVKSLEYPVLGACGGHQLLGYMFLRNFRRRPKLVDQPMRRLRKDEPDWEPVYHAGWYIEKGFHPVRIVKRDPIFAGLRSPMRVYEYHRCEIREVPAGFELLASTDECRIQAMRHQDAPIYGTQFHPEEFSDAYPDGRALLTNFFTIAGVMEQ